MERWAQWPSSIASLQESATHKAGLLLRCLLEAHQTELLEDRNRLTEEHACRRLSLETECEDLKCEVEKLKRDLKLVRNEDMKHYRL